MRHGFPTGLSAVCVINLNLNSDEDIISFGQHDEQNEYQTLSFALIKAHSDGYNLDE